MKDGLYISMFVITGTLTFSAILQAQNRILFPITARDNGGLMAIDTFGFHINATYCNDGMLDSDLVEIELPPKSPTGSFDFRFTEHRAGSTCLGVGQRIHIQGVPSSDTFRFEFQPGSGGYPFVFTWNNDLGWLGCAILQDVFGGFFVNVNMRIDTTATVTNPALTTLNIITHRYGSCFTPVEESELSSLSYHLSSNYPNPFNPSTEILYSIPTDGQVVLRIFDILGQEVTTLVNERKEVGKHTVEWKADGVPSGIYFYRIVSGDFIETKKMVLLK